MRWDWVKELRSESFVAAAVDLRNWLICYDDVVNGNWSMLSWMM